MKLITLRQLEAQARTGDGKACLALYQEYSNNTRDEKTARKWLDLALDYDEPRAQFLEGVYSMKVGEIAHGVQFLKLAAFNRNTDAMNVLAMYYLGNIHGISHTVIDLELGLDYLYQAANGGCPDAQIVLGKCFYLGKWVSRNKYLARYWMEKAAKAKSRLAARMLEDMQAVSGALN
ncbi:tetratricopeptide repeat protein [Allobaculum fili]|uniref:tetratricopeptide repeat protein n=2 Tax=Erysipelotrichaceae TaxID=128827 RepID=UPI001E33ECCC|nr:tetratricopeptide repeat protein [Allobaculum fili]